jgi:sugar/nucleoside kinase (ribokinase family)
MFVGTLAGQVVREKSMADAIRFAQAAAALHVSCQLDRRKDINPQSVKAFLENQDNL